MSIMDLLKPEVKKRKIKEVKEKLNLNPKYFQEEEAYRRKKEVKSFGYSV